MIQSHQSAIQKNFVMLNKEMIADEEFLSHMIQENIFTQNNMEEVLSEKTNNKKNNRFLMILQRRGPKAFPAFLKALVATCQDHIAERLDKKATDALVAIRERETNGLTSPTQESGSPFANPSGVPPQPPHTNFFTQPVNNDESGFMTIRVPPADMSDPKMLELYNDEAHVYKVKSTPRGRAVIINNEYFLINPETEKKLSDRDGTGFDLVNLDQLFQQLHFTTTVHNNLTRDEILEVVKKEGSKEKENQNSDAFILCILSHGAQGFVFGIDGRLVSIENEICATFDGIRCPSLMGKPKIFIVQACQGRESTTGVVVPDADSETNYITEALKKLNTGDTHDAAPTFLKDNMHEKADMLIAYSTIGGYKSWRRPDLGSWFVRAIVDIFAQRSYSEHIVDMLTKVRSKVIKQKTSYQAGDVYVQVTKTDSTLTKDFYFFPGYRPS